MRVRVSMCVGEVLLLLLLLRKVRGAGMELHVGERLMLGLGLGLELRLGGVLLKLSTRGNEASCMVRAKLEVSGCSLHLRVLQHRVTLLLNDRLGLLVLLMQALVLLLLVLLLLMLVVLVVVLMLLGMDLLEAAHHVVCRNRRCHEVAGTLRRRRNLLYLRGRCCNRCLRRKTLLRGWSHERTMMKSALGWLLATLFRGARFRSRWAALGKRILLGRDRTTSLRVNRVGPRGP